MALWSPGKYVLHIKEYFRGDHHLTLFTETAGTAKNGNVRSNAGMNLRRAVQVSVSSFKGIGCGIIPLATRVRQENGRLYRRGLRTVKD